MQPRTCSLLLLILFGTGVTAIVTADDKLSPPDSIKKELQSLNDNIKNLHTRATKLKPGDPLVLNPQPEPPGKPPPPGDPLTAIQSIRKSLSGIQADLKRGANVFDKGKVAKCEAAVADAEKALDRAAKSRGMKDATTALEEFEAHLKPITDLVATAPKNPVPTPPPAAGQAKPASDKNTPATNPPASKPISETLILQAATGRAGTSAILQNVQHSGTPTAGRPQSGTADLHVTLAGHALPVLKGVTFEKLVHDAKGQVTEGIVTLSGDLAAPDLFGKGKCLSFDKGGQLVVGGAARASQATTRSEPRQPAAHHLEYHGSLRVKSPFYSSAGVQVEIAQAGIVLPLAATGLLDMTLDKGQFTIGKDVNLGGQTVTATGGFVKVKIGSLVGGAGSSVQIGVSGTVQIGLPNVQTVENKPFTVQSDNIVYDDQNNPVSFSGNIVVKKPPSSQAAGSVDLTNYGPIAPQTTTAARPTPSTTTGTTGRQAVMSAQQPPRHEAAMAALARESAHGKPLSPELIQKYLNLQGFQQVGVLQGTKDPKTGATSFPHNSAGLVVFADAKPVPGAEHIYYVVADNGRLAKPSNRVSITPHLKAATAAVTGLQKVAHTGPGVRLAWQGNAKSYLILRAGKPGDTFQQLGAMQHETSFGDVSALAGHSYTYHVVAVSDGGHVSTPAELVVRGE